MSNVNQKCVASPGQVDWLEVTNVAALRTLKRIFDIFQIIVDFSVPSPILAEMDSMFLRFYHGTFWNMNKMPTTAPVQFQWLIQSNPNLWKNRKLNTMIIQGSKIDWAIKYILRLCYLQEAHSGYVWPL